MYEGHVKSTGQSKRLHSKNGNRIKHGSLAKLKTGMRNSIAAYIIDLKKYRAPVNHSSKVLNSGETREGVDEFYNLFTKMGT